MKFFGNLFKWHRDHAGHDPLAEALEEAINEFESGDYTLALKHFEMLANAVPGHPLANLLLGRTQLALENYAEAIMSFLTHLENWPDSVEAMILLGIAHFEIGHFESAEERFEQALILKRDSLMIHENLAITLIRQNKLEEARDELVAVHESMPHDCEILQLLVLVYGKLGKWDTAKQLFSKECEGKKLDLNI